MTKVDSYYDCVAQHMVQRVMVVWCIFAGNFCFGGCTMFKAQTIVEFIENAVETSRSGRYLFFLNLRPLLGPVRVQLLYPVSRFKRVQSLQHMCRYYNYSNFVCECYKE